ncbi:MAG: AraC family transcriptional regulator [Verrucomicrobia bacterium]|nr:AraC family transcriptional regulator [Verrucomicrobiota bacterium]
MRAERTHQILSGFFLENPLPGLTALTHCGEALVSPRHRLKPHAHRGFEFVYLSRGRAYWRIRDEVVPQRLGDLLVTFPREIHDTGREPGVECYVNWLGLDLEGLGRDGRRVAALLRARRVRVVPDCHEIEAVLRGLHAQLATARPRRGAVVRQYLRTFLALLEQRLSRPGRGEVPGGVRSATTERALGFLRDNVDRRTAVRELAAAARGGSVARFSARFRREVGLTPAAYHLRQRLDAARQALRQPESRVTHVALRYGFSSSQHFSTAFRRVFGVTPRAWRAGK